MKRVRRPALPDETQAQLNAWTQALASEPDASGPRAWDARRSSAAITEVRKKLMRMATGLSRCMYCEDSRGTDVEHFWPKAPHPLGTFCWCNHLLICARCNARKGDRFPTEENGLPTLLDPSVDDPTEHLWLTPSTGKYRPRSWRGLVTCCLLELNDAILVSGRKARWDTLVGVQLPSYHEASIAGDKRTSDRIRSVISKEPFASVLVYVLAVARTGYAARSLPPACLRALASCSEIREWV